MSIFFRPQVKKSLEQAFLLVKKRSGESFPQCIDNSFRQTVAGIFFHKKMNESLMLEGHLDSTKRL